jgi:glycosyltransferase involved in cell wall biosynthesis
MKENRFKYDIIIVGLQPWDVALGSNCVDMAKIFSKTCRVLYVNRASDRRTELKKWFIGNTSKQSGGKRKGYKLSNVQTNIWVFDTGLVLESINFFKGGLFNYLLKRNCKKLAASIKFAITDLGFKDYLLFNDNDFFQGQFLKEELSPRLYIYYLRDYLINQPYFRKNGSIMERKLLEKADLIFTNSNYLQRYAATYNSSSFYIGQGCNLNITTTIENTVEPKDLVEIKKPIIGYVGNLVTLRLDLSLLEKVVSNRQELSWVFVGPLDDGFAKSKLRKLPNVIFTGHKSQVDLPIYISSFDVCINPQLLNETTVGNYPRKIDEYMLFGKPVVARKTEFTQELGDLIYQYETEDEFLQSLDHAIAEDASSLKIHQRKTIAGSHTWDNSVKKLVETIETFEKSN